MIAIIYGKGIVLMKVQKIFKKKVNNITNLIFSIIEIIHFSKLFIIF